VGVSFLFAMWNGKDIRDGCKGYVYVNVYMPKEKLKTKTE